MDINKKLEFYKNSNRRSPQNTQPEYSSAVRALSEHFNAEILYPQAPLLKITRHYQIPDSFHNLLSESVGHSLSFLARNSAKETINLQECIFFDLETTGLMGGSGTFPFLQGFGRIEKTKFIIDQYFLPEFGREYYLYKELLVFLEKFDTLISYNGKSYDLPLLKSRFIMNQFKPGFDRFEHLDLLHIARRIWKDSFSSCDLISIESNVLNRTRTDDIPGWLIPQAYFDFLNYGRIHDILKIIEHNYLDIISLFELLLVLFKINSDPADMRDPKTLVRLAGLAFEHGKDNIFKNIYNSVSNGSPAEMDQLHVWHSLIHKRNSDWVNAISLWEELLSSETHAFFAFEELAKYYEHQDKKFAKALDISDRALHKISLLKELEYTDPALTEIEQRFLYRRRRLLSKIS